MLGKDLVIIAKNSLTTKSLFNEMTTQGIKFTPGNVVSAGKDNGGKIIFLEKEIQKRITTYCGTELEPICSNRCIISMYS